MSPAEISAIRSQLGMTQVQLGLLLGVHSLTISKWERDRLIPAPYHQAILETGLAAVKNQPGIGAVVTSTLATSGVPRALYEMLRAAFDSDGNLPPPCRRCMECQGAQHHWIENGDFLDAGDPEYECKHCPAKCRAIDGDDGFMEPDNIPIYPPERGIR